MSSVWFSNLCLRLLSSEVKETHAVNFLPKYLFVCLFFFLLGDGSLEEFGMRRRALLCSAGLAVPLDGYILVTDLRFSNRIWEFCNRIWETKFLIKHIVNSFKITN